MFAAAMAFSLGLKLENIRHGLQTFDTTFFQAPGRGNIFDEHPFRVILDYGHNAAAVEAMTQFVDRLDVKGRRIVVLSAPGDRRDEDVREIARIVAGCFDLYVCRRDDGLRGRGPSEIPEMLRDVLLAEGVDADQILLIPDEQEATAAALGAARAGDLVLVFGDAIQRTWEQIVNFRPVEAERRSARRPRAGTGATLPPQEAQTPRAFVRDVRGVRLARETEAAD
jgi:cyanophycin synthetase